MAFTCPRCEITSHHPADEAEGYCGRCHWWTAHPTLARYQPTAQGWREPDPGPPAEEPAEPGPAQ